MNEKELLQQILNEIRENRSEIEYIKNFIDFELKEELENIRNNSSTTVSEINDMKSKVDDIKNRVDNTESIVVNISNKI